MNGHISCKVRSTSYFVVFNYLNHRIKNKEMNGHIEIQVIRIVSRITDSPL